ncbi:amidohydrolase [Cladophialophora carrionii]|uniref:Amidohydrolase n=1 Tax=Cladophialophora carrionii TaxID=86049 RepID=A0A1C1CF91_9EURO|nr:amidohydrolase [Cladophialophora carrionii]
MRIKHAILPGRDPNSRWDVDFESNTITGIRPAAAEEEDRSRDNPSPLLLPPLCHPHIHLDKAYLLTCNHQHQHQHRRHPSSSSQAEGVAPPSLDKQQHPDYSDLTPRDGSFGEALQFTSLAKQRYTDEDLYLRGAQLLATSLAQGVTACRAFVEIDHVTRQSCLHAAIRLKGCFRGKMKLQICAFAQDPLFSTDHGARNNMQVLQRALRDDGGEHVDVLGTTPYVEQSTEATLRNIDWAIETALEYSLHLDFHLDYNLDASRQAMVWEVLRLLREKAWTRRAKPGKTIVLGHCTRLTLFSDAEMARLAREIKESDLPVHFVGLPTSDLFMMGRPTQRAAMPSAEEEEEEEEEDLTSGTRPRGTLQVLDMIQKHGINACLSVNNVGNAFTPWGTGDPLALASLGVGIYQAGTDQDANLLFECVSSRARRAIGLHTASALEAADDSRDSSQEHGQGHDNTELQEGRRGELLLIRNKEYVACPGHLGVKIPARQQVCVRDVVWDPPQVDLRQILRCG